MPGVEPNPVRDLQKLWWSLGKRPWRSVVFIPVHPQGSAAEVAASLARVGTQLTGKDVAAVVASKLDADALESLGELLEDLRRKTARPSPASRPSIKDVTPGQQPGREGGSLLRLGGIDRLVPIGQGSRIVIAIPSVIAEPRGVAVARDADAVVLSIELGLTLVAEVRRTVDLIGRDRIAGCLQMVPK